MSLHTLADVVDGELRGQSSKVPSSSTIPSTMQASTQETNKSIAIISGDPDYPDESIDIKDTAKGPDRQRGGRSEEKGSVGKSAKRKKMARDSVIDEANDSKSSVAYRDYSNLSEDELHDPASPINASASAKEPPFPVKLHRILSNPDFQDVIAWLPHGRSWRVLKPKTFEERVIPLFFRHCRYSSFMRQVNGWGFHRVHQGSDVNSYFHELFLRGMPHLSLRMHRPSAKEMKARAAEYVHQDAPNSYKISEKNPLPEYDFGNTGHAKEKTVQDAGDTTNTKAEEPKPTNSVIQQKNQEQNQVQLQANALPQLLGLAAFQGEQKTDIQQLLAAQASQASNAPLQNLAAILGNLANVHSPQPQMLNMQPTTVPTAQQVGNTTSLMQMLAAQQAQQQAQQQQQQLAFLQNMGLLGGQATNAGLNTNADEVSKLRAALASTQMQNQVMAAALLSKHSQT